MPKIRFLCLQSPNFTKEQKRENDDMIEKGSSIALKDLMVHINTIDATIVAKDASRLTAFEKTYYKEIDFLIFHWGGSFLIRFADEDECRLIWGYKLHVFNYSDQKEITKEELKEKGYL